MRVNQGQEFVIGGYTPSAKNFDALIFGYYEGKRLNYVARCRNGFTPALRADLAKRLRGLEMAECPFSNLPEARSGRWGVGLTAAKMKECRWIKPELVARVEFAEWTLDDHLRHSKFVGLREDKKGAGCRAGSDNLKNGVEVVQPFSHRNGFKVAHFVILYVVPDFNRAAAHFTVFDIGLLTYRSVQHHRYALTTVWANEEVLHAGQDNGNWNSQVIKGKSTSARNKSGDRI